MKSKTTKVNGVVLTLIDYTTACDLKKGDLIGVDGGMAYDCFAPVEVKSVATACDSIEGDYVIVKHKASKVGDVAPDAIRFHREDKFAAGPVLLPKKKVDLEKILPITKEQLQKAAIAAGKKIGMPIIVKVGDWSGVDITLQICGWVFAAEKYGMDEEQAMTILGDIAKMGKRMHDKSLAGPVMDGALG